MLEQPNIDFATYNKQVREWGRSNLPILRARLSILGIKETGELLRELNVRYRSKYGRVRSVGYLMPAHGIYVHLGAGRGYGGSKGSEWYTKMGEKRRTSRESMGRMGTGARRAKPWFDPVIDMRMPELADTVAAFWADAAIGNMKIQR